MLTYPGQPYVKPRRGMTLGEKYQIEKVRSHHSATGGYEGATYSFVIPETGEKVERFVSSGSTLSDTVRKL